MIAVPTDFKCSITKFDGSYASCCSSAISLKTVIEIYHKLRLELSYLAQLWRA